MVVVRYDGKSKVVICDGRYWFFMGRGVSSREEAEKLRRELERIAKELDKLGIPLQLALEFSREEIK